MARTNLHSDSDTRVNVQLSYDDSIQVFLNGVKIYSNAELKDGFVTQNIEADLSERENSLLIKTLDTPNNNTMWAGISLRVLN